MTAPVIERAYSVLHIKSIADDHRTISGIATTPEPDRLGDIVEPLGITARSPLPLLLYHDHTKPVGSVRFHKATKDGVGFEATIPQIAEPGTLRDRVDEAWQSIKARLVTGVSIGLRVLEGGVEAIKGTNGLRFTKTELLELSLVTVPANASARITTIKSLDVGRPAATGHRVSVAPVLPGASGVSRDHTMNRTASEFLTQYESERATKAAKAAELMQKASAAGVTMDDAQNDEYDRLTADIGRLDAHISRARELEAIEQRSARPVQATSHIDAVRSRGGETVQVSIRDPLPPGTEYIRSLICRGASLLTGQSPEAIAKQRYPDHPRIAMVFKTAADAAVTSTASWAGDLVNPANLASEFVEFLRPQTIVGRIPGLRRVPFNVRIVGQTSGASASWVGQGKLKPVTQFAVNAVTLTWAKIAAISVLSDELFRFSSPSAEALIRDELAKAIVERMDTDFIAPSKSVDAGVSPASITNGLVAGTPSGTDAASVRADVATMLSEFVTENQNLGGAVWIMPNTIALALSLMRNPLGQPEFGSVGLNGGIFEGLPVVTSQYAAVGSPVSNLVILANANEIFLSDDGGVTIDVSREASIEMETDPENQSGTVVNMFQTNQLALRAERYINWAKRRASAVTYMDDVAWGS